MREEAAQELPDVVSQALPVANQALPVASQALPVAAPEAKPLPQRRRRRRHNQHLANLVKAPRASAWLNVGIELRQIAQDFRANFQVCTPPFSLATSFAIYSNVL